MAGRFSSSLRSRLLIDVIVTGSCRSSMDDGVYHLECHAAQIDIFIASYHLIDLPIPVLEPLFGMGHKAGGIRESRFELADSS